MAHRFQAFIDFREARDRGDPKTKKMRDALVVANIPLAKHISVRYKKYTKTSTELDDLMQAAYIGLCMSVDGFDPARAAFSTYATFKIIHEIQTCIAKDRRIKKPKAIKSSDAEQHYIPFDAPNGLDAHREATIDNEMPQPDAARVEFEQWRDILPALKGLAPLEFDILTAYVFEELPVYKIAKRHAMSKDAVQGILNTCISQLKDSVDDWCDTH